MKLTLFDGDETGVQSGHKTGLWQRIFQTEKFVFGYGVGAGFEDGFGPNRT